MGAKAEQFLGRLSTPVYYMNLYAEESATARSVDEQLVAIRGMRDAHQMMRELLPSPDAEATRLLDVGIAAVIGVATSR